MKKILAVAGAALLVGSALTLVACNKKASADGYPKKGITMICPWGAGGGTDAVLRAICGAAENSSDRQSR